MSDIARHSAPQPAAARHTLMLAEVGAQLEAAGVPRSKRHIVRLCQSGLFDAMKLPGATGDEWFVAPESVPKAIGDLIAIQKQRERRSAPQRATSGHGGLEVEANLDQDTARHSAPQHATAGSPKEGTGETEPATSRYVTLLERDNEFLRDQVQKKDEQITDLSNRFRETQTLLGAMQRMVAPLLGQADPFTSPEKREASERGTSAEASPPHSP